MKPTIIRRTRADKLFDTLNVILMAIVLVALSPVLCADRLRVRRL